MTGSTTQPRRCPVCLHPQCTAINVAILSGMSLRAVARQFSPIATVSRKALGRHKANHLPEAMAVAQVNQEIARADDLFGQVEGLRADAHRIKGQAEARGDYRTALGAVRELTRIVDLCIKVAIEVHRREEEAPATPTEMDEAFLAMGRRIYGSDNGG